MFLICPSKQILVINICSCGCNKLKFIVDNFYFCVGITVYVIFHMFLIFSLKEIPIWICFYVYVIDLMFNRPAVTWDLIAMNPEAEVEERASGSYQTE